VADFWQVPVANISPKPGKAAVDMFKAAAAGEIKILWIACTNPVVSMPDTDTVVAALRRAELVIVQDAYHPTDTTMLAHVLLPAAQFSEREGVMTNSERRLTYLPKMVNPPGEALPDWEIFARFGREMGFAEAFSYGSTADVFAEFAKLTEGRVCDYSTVTHERLQAEGPLQWPVRDEVNAGQGDIALYTGHQFATANGRAKFFAPGHAVPKEVPDDMYPLVLNTGRLPDQWHTMTRTGKSAQLLKDALEPFIEIHPADARRFDINDGEMVKIASRRGVAIVAAVITDQTREGTVFMPFHWGRMKGHNLAANNLTIDVVDPISQEPELKACAVSITPVWAAEWKNWIDKFSTIGSSVAEMQMVAGD
jgi:ferredoxin-nitrate reductase